MKHTESSVKIYFSNDYKEFKFLKGNRHLNEKKIDRIIKDIKRGNDLLKYCPIIVDTQMNIIDGQHRFYVAQKIKSKVWYVVAPEHSLYDIAKINSNTDKWKNDDFINCYAEQGVPDYKLLADFIDKYKINITVAIQLLMHGQPAVFGNIHMNFKLGDFRVKHEKAAIEIIETAKSFSDFKAWKSRHFIRAIYMLMKAKKYDHHRLVEKFTKKPEMITVRGSYKDYLIDLEKLYNEGLHTRIAIY